MKGSMDGGIVAGIETAIPPTVPGEQAEKLPATWRGDGLQRQEMSEEEKERRREECARMYEYCYDAYTKRHPKDPPARGRCQQDCSDKNTECMKKIESNPIHDPDY